MFDLILIFKTILLIIAMDDFDEKLLELKSKKLIKINNKKNKIVVE